MRTSVRYNSASILALCYLLLAIPSQADTVLGSVWSGMIYDQAAGAGALQFSFGDADRGGVDGSFTARFRDGKLSNQGTISHLLLTGPASATFDLDSAIRGACAYVVDATIADGRMRGSYRSAGDCTANRGTFDIARAT